MTAIVRALLALALLSSMALGCGGSDEEAAEPTESQVAAGEEETTPAEEETMPVEDTGDDMGIDEGSDEDYGDEGMPE